MFGFRQQKRVRIREDIDLQPWTTLKQGEQGSVVNVETDASGIVSADILMDEKHAGLNRWRNEAHIEGPELDALEFSSRNRPHAVTMCVSSIVACLGVAMLSGVATAETIDIYCNRIVEMAVRVLLSG